VTLGINGYHRHSDTKMAFSLGVAISIMAVDGSEIRLYNQLRLFPSSSSKLDPYVVSFAAQAPFEKIG